MTDEEYYDDTESDDEELLLGDDDLEVLDPPIDTIYNLEVISCKAKSLPMDKDDPEGERQSLINVQFAFADGEFEGERQQHTFWLGPKGSKDWRHKNARKSFNRFFEACTGERIGKGSTVNPRDCEGNVISAKLVSAAYPDKENPGQFKREGQVKWEEIPGRESWSTPIDVSSDDDWDDEDPV